MPSPTLFETSPQEDRPSAEEWSYEFVPALIRGINTGVRPTGLPPEQCVVADNIRFTQEQVLSDLGYVVFGSTVVGKPRATYQFHKKNGTSVLTLLTNSRFYEWDTVVSEWQYVGDGTSTTLSSAASATDTSIEVNDITGFSDGDPIGIELDDGTQHKTTINGAPSGSTINIDDAMPGAAAIGNDVLKTPALSGSDDILPSFTTWAGTDKMYFTNGVDAVKSFDGTSVSDVSGLPANTKARVVTIHENHLILLNTEESGTAHPQRERWSEPGDDTSWNTSVNFNDHLDTEDHILSAEELGVYLIIYKERTLIRQEFVGSADQTWNWVTTVNGEGAVTRDCVVNLGDEHIFWGNSNVYRYRGGFDIDPIGDNIFDGVFSAINGDLNPERKERIFGLYVEELDEAWFFYPQTGTTFPRRVAKLKLVTGAWSFRDFTFDVTGFGFYSKDTTVTWSSAQGTWAEAVGPWLGSSLQAESPTVQLCDGTNLRVYDYNFSATKDNTADIPYEFVTKDWYVPNRELRFDRYDIEMKGFNILVEISVDGGNNYETLGTVSPGTLYQRERFHRQIVGRSLRFRFTGQESFGLQNIGFLYKRESVQP